MELFDVHAHYNDEKFDKDRVKIIESIYNSGVTSMITAGYSIESSIKAVKLAEDYNYIYATAGISPNDIDDLPNDYIERVKSIAFNKKVVAIGEIGLDYYWNKENAALQKEVFIKQIELANELGLPIVIHTRDAVMDTIDILENRIICNNKGIFHCCPFNVDLVREGLKLGFYISFCGPVTFKNSKNAEAIVNMVPMDRIVIETDSPYLSPEPVRGTRNDSRNIRYIAEKIAMIKGVSVEEIAEQTYRNARTIFKIGDNNG